VATRGRGFETLAGRVGATLSGTVLVEPDVAADGALLLTRDAVLALLPACAVAHFACHATSDPHDPSASRLLLHDHATAPLTVAALITVVRQHARLAYLSACRTAMNDASDLDDEAIHLSSAFQLAGFPHVVGTLWEVPDGPAARIADDFYAGIGTGTSTAASGAAGVLVDLRRSPYALHDAVRAARATCRRASAWAAHVHSGA
jgi:CHAT domain